jgi:hypothetical protein
VLGRQWSWKEQSAIFSRNQDGHFDTILWLRRGLRFCAAPVGGLGKRSFFRTFTLGNPIFRTFAHAVQKQVSFTVN